VVWRRLSTLQILVLVAALALPAGAAAEEGVFVDPGSPAGKEYAIPLAQARRDASGDQGSAPKASNDAPLFGQGITRRARSKPAAGRSGNSPAARPGAPEGDEPPSQLTAAERRELASASTAPGPGTGWTLALGLGAAALGVGLGLGLRRL
jgi:hypothetical protein